MAARGTGKVQAWHVETGEAAELEWPPTSDALRWSIVLAADGARLDPGGPAPQGPVFVYSRKTLEADAPEPAPLPIDIEEAAEPPLPQRAEPHTNPMLAAYQAFEYQFSLHAAKARAQREAIERRREASARLFAESEAQVRGIRAAQSNVEATHRELMAEYAAFRDTFAARHAAHGALLASFEDDMRRLLQARLHGALATPQRQTLLDCIPEARFRSWADTCRHEHEQLAARVVELDALMRDLREAVESDAQRNVVDMEPLRRMAARSAETGRTAAAQSEVMERDLEAIRGTLRTSLAALAAARAFNWASCDGFSTMQKAHETQLAELAEANRLSKDTMAFFAQTKNRLRREVWHRLRAVAALQNRVRDAHNRLAVFRQALQRQSSACDQLLTLHEMPAAYFASLDEVHRRQRFARSLTAALERVSGRLEAAREAELGRREAFLERHGRFILKDLVPGLDEALPSFQLAAPRLDAALPHLGAPPAHLADADAEPGLFLEPPAVRQAEAEAAALRHRVRELEDRARALAATAGGATHSTSAGLRGDKSGEEALAKAEKQRDEYVARIGALEAKLSRMYELNAQLQTRLSDTETLASSAPHDPDAALLRQRLAEAEAAVVALRARVQQAEEASKEARAKVAQASEEAKARALEAAESAAQLQAQREACTALQRELKTLQLDGETARGEAEARAAALKREAEEAEARRKALEARLASEQAATRQAESEAKARGEREAAAALRAKELEAELEAQKARTDGATKSQGQLGQALREREAEARAAEAALAEAQEQARAAQQQAKAARALQNEEAAAWAKQVKELSELLAAAQRTAKEAEEREARRGAEGSELQRSAEQTRRELEAARGQLSEALRKQATAEEEGARLRARQAELEKAMAERERAVAELRARGDSAEKSAAEAKALSGAVSAALTACRLAAPRGAASEAAAAAQGIALLTSEYSERVKAEEAARRRLEATSAALNEAEARAKEASKKVEELSSQVLVLTLELQDLKSQRAGGGGNNGPAAAAAAARKEREAIALRDFEVGDIVMFWSNAQHVYEAYTYVRGGQRAPKYYLSEDSFPSFEKERAASLVIMGTVVSREQLAATGTDYTRLPSGETYFELIVQRLD